jgi:hypothetical protein
MSDSENYETTFNHFLLHFLSYLCKFCLNTCSQEAKLMKWSHLGVVTLWVHLFEQFSVAFEENYALSNLEHSMHT